jgi:hypothetical protein
MKIKIPKRHLKYVKLLIEESEVSENETIRNLYDKGRGEILIDLHPPYPAYYPPDMDNSLIYGETCEIDVAHVPTDDEKNVIKNISKLYGITKEVVIRSFFLQGLFNSWPILRSSMKYMEDLEFRKMVDRMPHNSAFEQEYTQANNCE